MAHVLLSLSPPSDFLGGQKAQNGRFLGPKNSKKHKGPPCVFFRDRAYFRELSLKLG